MKNKEEIITLWFNMWLEKKDLGIDRIFSKNILYTESLFIRNVHHSLVGWIDIRGCRAFGLCALPQRPAEYGRRTV